MMHPDVNERVINGVREKIRGRGVGEGDCGITVGGWIDDGCRLVKRKVRISV